MKRVISSAHSLALTATLALVSACGPLTQFATRPLQNVVRPAIRPSARPQPSAASASPVTSPTAQATAAPLATAVPAASPVTSSSPTPSPAASASASASASPSPLASASASATPFVAPTATASPSASASASSAASPFEPLSQEDVETLSLYADESVDTSQSLSSAEEQAISDDLLASDAELSALLSFELTTDGGPLLYTSEAAFSTSAFSIQALGFTPPRAWKRTDFKRGGHRFHAHRLESGQVELWSVQERRGKLLIDLDGTPEAPSPGSKPIHDLQIRRVLLAQQDGHWQLKGISTLLDLPANPAPALLPHITRVRVSQAAGVVLSLNHALSAAPLGQIPALVKGSLAKVEAEFSSSDSRFAPPAALYLHVGDKRVLFRDQGKGGDAQAADGLYTAVFTVPDGNANILHLAVDAIAAATLADETTVNYQAMTWHLPFRLTS